MNKLVLGVLLILMMFGHNYVLNQPQVLQAELQAIHNASVPKFNLLYSMPSAISIFFILPLGIMYDKYAQRILIGSAFVLLLGQLLVTVFGANPSSYAFPLLTLGRVLEGTTAEVLYMIQANLSSTWMGKLAGLTLILPEVGQISNVFLTLYIREYLGVNFALVVGFLTCLVSFIACLFLYVHIRNYHQSKKRNSGENMFTSLEATEQQSEQKEMNSIDSEKSQTQVPDEIDKEKKEAGDNVLLVTEQPKLSIFKAGKIFWLVVVLCAINECLYFPFLDNAKVLIQTRFCIPQAKTAFYLCLPYLSAIMVSILVGEHMLYRYSRQKLIFASSLLPLVGHSVIYMIKNCQGETTYLEEVLLIIGFVLFGTGIAGYYSISMPAVGLSVPESIRGTAFACLGFFQTLTMTAVPIISGYIIEQDTQNYMKGYRDSSFLFVCLCLSACAVSLYIMLRATPDSFKYVEESDIAERQSLGKQERQSEVSLN